MKMFILNVPVNQIKLYLIILHIWIPAVQKVKYGFHTFQTIMIIKSQKQLNF